MPPTQLCEDIAVVVRNDLCILQPLFFLPEDWRFLFGLIFIAFRSRLVSWRLRPRFRQSFTQLPNGWSVTFPYFFDQNIEHKPVDKDGTVFELTGKMFAQGLLVYTHILGDPLMSPTCSHPHHYKVLIFLVLFERRPTATVSDGDNPLPEHVVLNDAVRIFVCHGK